MPKLHFRPWRRDAAGAAASLALAAAATIAWVKLDSVSGCFAIAATAGAIGCHLAVRARNRWYGQSVERRALRALSREPLSVRSNVMSRHGDIDAVVSARRSRVRYAIEIKAWHTRRRVTAAALRQTSENASALNCVGVLWLPNAPLECLKHGDVWIFCGAAPALTNWVMRRAE